jgi:hypothetical protein
MKTNEMKTPMSSEDFNDKVEELRAILRAHELTLYGINERDQITNSYGTNEGEDNIILTWDQVMKMKQEIISCFNCSSRIAKTKTKRWYHGDQDDLICPRCATKLKSEGGEVA